MNFEPVDTDERNIESYSTTEQVIGTWTDGKPLYRKTFISTSPSASATPADVATIESTFIIHSLAGILRSSSTSEVVINEWAGDANTFCRAWRYSDTSIRMNCKNANYLSKPIEITITYTKSTD